jgi:hypothetical protein
VQRLLAALEHGGFIRDGSMTGSMRSFRVDSTV